MDNILRERIGMRCLVYMDEIIIYSTSLQEHLTNLHLILETLRKYNMKIQIDKCEFLQKQVAFLGHIVTTEGKESNPIQRRSELFKSGCSWLLQKIY